MTTKERSSAFCGNNIVHPAEKKSWLRACVWHVYTKFHKKESHSLSVS